MYPVSDLLVRRFVLLLLPLVALAGCSQQMADVEMPAREALASKEAYHAAPQAADVPRDEAPTGGIPGDGITGGGEASTATGLARKIIYSANIELVVENLTGVPQRVIELVKQHDGYVADSRQSGETGANRQAFWKVRIPVARFEEFCNAAKGMGELVSAGVTSQDASEEYYDVEARVRNKTKEEERLLKLLEERPGKLEDVIAIERELSRVREELERMQGRMRVLTDLVSLTTVSITIQEIRDYQPPQAPTFATRIRRALEGSLTLLQSTAEGGLIALVAVLPWIAVSSVGSAALYTALRLALRAFRRRRALTA